MFFLLTKNWILSVTSYNYVLYRNSSSKTLTRPRSGWLELSGYNYWIHKSVEIHIFQPWTSSGLCQLSAFQSWWILTVLFCFSFVSVYMCVACFMYGCVSGCSTCLWVCGSVYTNQDRTSGFLLLPLPLHCFQRGSATDWKLTAQARLVFSELLVSAIFTYRCWDCRQSMLDFLWEYWGLELRSLCLKSECS